VDLEQHFGIKILAAGPAGSGRGRDSLAAGLASVPDIAGSHLTILSIRARVEGNRKVMVWTAAVLAAWDAYAQIRRDVPEH
jgi:hypothetical protein